MNSSSSVSDITSLDDLGRRVSGPVLAPGDARRPAELAGFNLAVVHDPDVVLGAVDAVDTAAGVGWAAARGLPVGVLATGHGWSVPVTGGLLIMTRRMQDIALDPSTGAVAGRRRGDVANGPRRRGSVGLGPAVRQLIGRRGGRLHRGRWVAGTGARVRLRGRSRHGTGGRHRRPGPAGRPHRHRDVRSGVVPGVVRRWGQPGCRHRAGDDPAATLDLYGGGLFYPGAAAGEVLSAWAAWSRDLPEAMSTSIALLRLPPLPELPEPLRGQFVVHVRTAFAGDAATAEEILTPLRRLTAPVLMDAIGELPYAALDAVHMDPAQPVPFRHGGVLLDDLPAEALDRLLAMAGPDAVCPLLLVELRRLGGALAQNPDPERSVLTGRTSAYSLHTQGMLVPPVADHVPAAITALLAGMARWADGSTLLNLHGSLIDEPHDAERARAWDSATLDRLVAAKATADPGNSFRLGHTLPAAAR